MAVVPEITCRRCGSKYSGLRSRCPKCGAPRMNQPTRVPPTTAAATPQTAANGRAVSNIRWQFIFGGVLLLALILAVIVLINGGSGKTNKPTGTGTAVTPAYIAADLPTPSPSPAPTPDASPTPVIESMAITFLNRTLPNHEMTLTEPLTTFTTYGVNYNIDLDVSTYPASEGLKVTWRSTNEKVLTVDEHGFVTVVGASPDYWVKAGIIAECGGLEDYLTIYVPKFQAAFLKENILDPETYFEDTRAWEEFIYATPTPRA